MRSTSKGKRSTLIEIEINKISIPKFKYEIQQKIISILSLLILSVVYADGCASLKNSSSFEDNYFIPFTDISEAILNRYYIMKPLKNYFKNQLIIIFFSEILDLYKNNKEIYDDDIKGTFSNSRINSEF
ncbi:hypothetical protein BpHYR1_029606 [Brachionus plicatilis]|uniref:Uncharacterized protein n=1 Tax=Brachionus plicatilis TaxID=10195 RepID=A0A3M7RPM9_BRAPC|nr:hypothetical protein BpHYR1_029606 [Brachionus plicatilis]